MTPEQIREYAEDIITSRTEDIDIVTVSEQLLSKLEGGMSSDEFDEVLHKVDDAIRDAQFTFTWSDTAPDTQGTEQPAGARVSGHCPMGCGTTLVLAAGGHVTCSHLHCPRPTAAHELLDDPEAEHVVELGLEVFTIRHPLRERLDDELFGCTLHDYLTGLAAAPVQPGRYRARPAGGGRWRWEALRPA